MRQRPLGYLLAVALVGLVGVGCGGASSAPLSQRDASVRSGVDADLDDGSAGGGSSASSGAGTSSETGSASGSDSSGGGTSSGSSSGALDASGGDSSPSSGGASDAASGSGSSSGAGSSGAEDGGNAAACERVCAGCCDSDGICQSGSALMVCGGNGTACADCTKKTNCPLAEAPCCKGVGGCGCAVGGLVGCN